MIKNALGLLTRYRQVNWALADQMTVSGVNFLTGILLARFLGIEDFGRFSLAWLAIVFANNLQHAMINSPMMSIGPKQTGAAFPAYLGSVMIQQAAFAVLVFVLLFGGVHISGFVFPEWKIEELALPLAVAGLATQAQDFLRRYFFSRLRSTTAFVCDAIRYFGQFGVLLALFSYAPERTSVAVTLWVIALTAAIAAGLSCIRVERPCWRAGVWKATLRRHWNFSKWLAGSALLHWTSGNLFLIAAGAILGPSAVGALKAAQTLIGMTHVLSRGLDNVIPVRAAIIFRDGGSPALISYLKRVAIFYVSLTALVALILSLAPEFWLRLAFGQAYANHGELVRWYAVVYLVAAAIFPISVGLRALEHLKPVFWSYISATAFSVVAAYPMTKWWEMEGVLLGILATEAIMVFVTGIALRRHLATNC